MLTDSTNAISAKQEHGGHLCKRQRLFTEQNFIDAEYGRLFSARSADANHPVGWNDHKSDGYGNRPKRNEKLMILFYCQKYFDGLFKASTGIPGHSLIGTISESVQMIIYAHPVRAKREKTGATDPPNGRLLEIQVAQG